MGVAKGLRIAPLATAIARTSYASRRIFIIDVIDDVDESLQP